MARRVYHILGMAIIITLYSVLDRAIALGMISGAILVTLTFDGIRQRSRLLQRRSLSWFRKVIRDEELKGLSGMSYLLLGVGIVIYLFPKDVGLLSLSMLGLGDPAASIIGVKYGRDPILGSKTLQGALASFAVCAVLTAIFVRLNGLFLDRWVLVSWVGGLIGMLSELIPIGSLDDNLTFPVMAASQLWVLFYVFGSLG